MEIKQQLFGVLDGQSITAYTLVNDHGMEVTSLDYGCVITKIITPNRNGRLENVVLGFDSMEEYAKHSPYFGAVVGRVAGRIKNAEFELHNKTYHLAANNNGNHLHGGLKGFDKVFWETEVVESESSISLIFSYLSKDMEEGYPGNLEMKATYTLTNENEFIITYTGESDQTTLLNVTNHTYFNLSGDLKSDIVRHRLTLKSSEFLELNESLLPTGELLKVDGTPFDFREGRILLDGIQSENPQNVLVGKGYDHPFLLDQNNQEEITLVDDESGRILKIETDMPCVVLYSGNQLSGENYFVRGVPAENYLGLCLETQGLPDSIHHPHFTSSIIEKGEKFQSITKYKFGIV